jgi:hypothetical protein
MRLVIEEHERLQFESYLRNTVLVYRRKSAVSSTSFSNLNDSTGVLQVPLASMLGACPLLRSKMKSIRFMKLTSKSCFGGR